LAGDKVFIKGIDPGNPETLCDTPVQLFSFNFSELFALIFYLVLAYNSLNCIFATPYKIRAG
jgi:hypothetical protein